MLNTWDVKDVYDGLMKDYKDAYARGCGKKSPWPLLIEARMSGVEISFTILVDKAGHYQILPTAMDYPERFERPPGLDNPITGGMGSISPHPLESPALLALADETLARPLIRLMAEQGTLRPGVLYPGCFASFDGNFQPDGHPGVRDQHPPGEPFQPVVKRLRNLGAMVAAMADGTLDKVAPEVRSDQVSLCMALVTGPWPPQAAERLPLVPDQGRSGGDGLRLFRQEEAHGHPVRHGLCGRPVQVRRLPGGVSPGQRHRQGRADHGRRPPSPCARSCSTPSTTARSGVIPGRRRQKEIAWPCAGTSGSTIRKRKR